MPARRTGRRSQIHDIRYGHPPQYSFDPASKYGLYGGTTWLPHQLANISRDRIVYMTVPSSGGDVRDDRFGRG